MSDTLVIDPEVIEWAVAGKPASEPHALTALASGMPLLVLMHGLGSHEGDLIQLAPHLPAEFVCASLRAPLRAYEPHDGYSWFPLSLQPGGVTPETAEGSTATAAEAVLDWHDALQGRLATVGAVVTKTALLGFSQGGVMVTTLLRLRPGVFSAGVNCSGFVAPGTFDGDAQLTELKQPLFWGRDAADPIISEAAVQLTAEWAPQHTQLTKREYPGIGHSISGEEIADINEFLRVHVLSA